MLIIAIDSRSRIKLFSEMRVAHGFRMEIEFWCFVVVKSGWLGRGDGADLSDGEREQSAMSKIIGGMAQLKCKDSPYVAQ